MADEDDGEYLINSPVLDLKTAQRVCDAIRAGRLFQVALQVGRQDVSKRKVRRNVFGPAAGLTDAQMMAIQAALNDVAENATDQALDLRQRIEALKMLVKVLAASLSVTVKELRKLKRGK